MDRRVSNVIAVGLTLRLAVCLVACGETQAPLEMAPAPSTDSVVAPEPGFTLETRDTPVAAQLSWVLGHLNAGGEVSAEEVTSHFAPSFLAKVPGDKARQVFADLAKKGPYVPKRATRDEALRLVVVASKPDGSETEIRVEVEEGSDHKIVGLLLRPAPPKIVVKLDPSSPAGEQAIWVLDAINSGELKSVEVEQRLNAKFLAALPAPSFISMVEGLHEQLAPVQLVDVKVWSPTRLEAHLRAKDGAELALSVNSDSDAPDKIGGLFIKPFVKPRTSLPSSWAEIERELGESGARTEVYAASIDPSTGVCTPIHSVRGAEPMALGSAFKLYVLSTLAKGVADGKWKWTDPLTIEADNKSLPSGQLQDREAGEQLPIKEFAAKMISISDNTATDHLIRKVTRRAVEDTLARSGHKHPELNRPFMTTREMFQIKLGGEAGRLEAYAKADEKGRRRTLKRLRSEGLPPLSQVISWKAPRAIDKVEWFASAEDLCALEGQLVRDRESVGTRTALELLTINDGGLHAEKKRWPYVGFKGGSEPGVFVLTYLVRRDDGKWFSIVIGANDDEHEITGSALAKVELVRAVLGLVGGGDGGH